MHMINLTYRYFTLNFKCNGSVGQAAAVSGISHILPGHFRKGGQWVGLDSTDWSQRHYLLCGIISCPGHGQVQVGYVDFANFLQLAQKNAKFKSGHIWPGHVASSTCSTCPGMPCIQLMYEHCDA